MTKRIALYKDANFRKCDTHMLRGVADRIPAVCYSYESASKLYDIIVKQDGGHIVRTNSKLSLPTVAHREIDKFFNLGLTL